MSLAYHSRVTIDQLPGRAGGLLATATPVGVSGSDREANRSIFLGRHEHERKRVVAIEARREALRRLVASADSAGFSEPLAAKGKVMFAKACELGLEGIVSAGGKLLKDWPSRNWLKARKPELRQDVSPCPAMAHSLVSDVRGPTPALVWDDRRLRWVTLS